MHTDQQLTQTRLLKSLGIPAGRIVSGKSTHRWDTRATHVVMPSLKRVTKSMAGMAAGCWLVSSRFVEDSAAKGELLDPVCCMLWVVCVTQGDTGCVRAGGVCAAGLRHAALLEAAAPSHRGARL